MAGENYRERHAMDEPDEDVMTDGERDTVDAVICDVAWESWNENNKDDRLENVQDRLWDEYQDKKGLGPDEQPGWMGRVREALEESRKNEAESSKYAGTLEAMAALDIAPPVGPNDIYTPNQLMARILRDGDDGYRRTVKEHNALKDYNNLMEGGKETVETGRIAAYYDTALSTVNAIRAIAETNATLLEPADWRHDLNEHLVQSLKIDG